MESDQRLLRFGREYEQAASLEEQAHRAFEVLGVHGVSATEANPEQSRVPASEASRQALAASGFQVHDTPTRRNPRHKTIELPHPVDIESANRFNRIFGRIE